MSAIIFALLHSLFFFAPQRIPGPGGETISGGGGSNVIFVQNTAASWSNTCILTGAVTSGHTAYGWVVSGSNNTAFLGGVTDDKSNSYTLLTAETVAGVNFTKIYAQIFYLTNVTNGPSTLTLNWDSGLQPTSLWAFGCLESSASTIDGVVHNATGVSATPSAGTLTPAGAGEFGISVAISDDGIGGGLTVGSGWTTLTANSGGSESNGGQYQHNSSASPITGNFTNGGNSGTWVASGALFK